MPLLKRGVPVEPVQIEAATAAKGFLTATACCCDVRGQAAIAVSRRLGVGEPAALVVIDDDKDPYNAAEWWNTPPLAFKTPRQHLFRALATGYEGTGSRVEGRCGLRTFVAGGTDVRPGRPSGRDFVYTATEAVGALEQARP
jgi:hypothetical protein